VDAPSGATGTLNCAANAAVFSNGCEETERAPGTAYRLVTSTYRHVLGSSHPFEKTAAFARSSRCGGTRRGVTLTYRVPRKLLTDNAGAAGA